MARAAAGPTYALRPALLAILLGMAMVAATVSPAADYGGPSSPAADPATEAARDAAIARTPPGASDM